MPLVQRGRVHDVVGAQDDRDVGLAELAVDVVHLEHLVVGHLGLGQQHVHVARHAAGHRMDRVLHGDALAAVSLAASSLTACCARATARP